jgi:hypothetical protein
LGCRVSPFDLAIGLPVVSACLSGFSEELAGRVGDFSLPESFDPSGQVSSKPGADHISSVSGT